MKKNITKTLALIAALCGLNVFGAEMYYNRLSTGDKIIPAGKYGDIVVPVGGYKATQFPSALGTISQATGDYGGSYAKIVTTVGKNNDLMDHTISGWFKVPTKSGETTLCVEKTSSSYANSRGNAIRVSAAGKLLVGKVKNTDAWQDSGTHITSTGTIPINQWFYLTVAITVDHTARTATAKAYVNGVEIEMPETAFACNYNGASCAELRVGDNVECAGLRVDDAVIDDAATMKAWATDEKYVESNPAYAMPYVSMGYRTTDDTTGTFLTYDSQLAFPGCTLEDVLAHDFFGRLTGKNIATYDKGYEGGLQIGRHIQAWTNDQPQLEKVLFTVNGRKTSTYAKVVTVLLTNGVDGVYAVVPENGACNSSSAAEGDKFAEFNEDGSIKLTGGGKTLATSDTASGYGCRGLTMTRYIPSDKPVLAFKNTTVDAIKYHTFTGYSVGRSMANGYTSIPMASYNEKVTEESAGVATKLRAEMQVIDGSYLKCVVVEFTDGTDGVYVKALTARYVGKAQGLGYKFVNPDGSYNGTNRTYARDFSIDGYGVFALKAYAPPAWAAVATWTNAVGDADPTVAENWVCYDAWGRSAALPDATMTVKIGGETALNTTSTQSFACKAIELTDNVTLTGDSDWSYLPDVTITTNSKTIDVNGHNLTLNRVFAGAITDGTSGDPGSLTMDVAENTTIENTELSIQGNLKFVKGGAGTFLTHKTQSYTGGNVVNAGVLKLPAETSGRYYVGADGSTITVGPNGTFNMNGCYDLNVYPITLAGGTLSNERVDQTTYTNGGLGDVTLTADSFMYVGKHTLFHKSAGATLDLGGHTLTVTGNSKYCSFSNGSHAYTIRNGTLVISTGAQLNTRVAAVDLTDANIVIEANGKWLHNAAEFIVKNLTMENNTGSDKKVYVTGTFKSATGNFKYVCLKNGATLDLTGNTGALETTGKNLTFEESAAITVDIHGRDLAKGDQVVAWSAKPDDVTFQWDDATLAKEPEELTTTSSGIYYGVSIATAYWTNALGDGKLEKTGNWACTNTTGQAVADVLPTAESTVYFTGNNINVQITDAPIWAAVNVNGKLGGNCDWTGLVATPIVEGSSIDVNGHSLALANVFTGTVTDATVDVEHPGTLTMSVGEDETIVNTTLSIQGNLKFVKEGAGTFDGRRANQLFTGGTVVNEGTITSNESETKLHWGAEGKSVTVEPNGVLDVKNNLSWCYHKIILNGGAISNVTANVGIDKQGIGDIVLTADSKVVTKHHTMFSDNRSGSAAAVNLGGWTLTFEHLSNPSDDKSVFYFNNTVVSNGTIRFNQKAKFNPRKAACMGEDVTLDMQGDFFLDAADITVKNFIDGSKGNTQTVQNGRRVSVTGRYTPQSDVLVNVTLKNGATLDLTEQVGTWTFGNRLTAQTIVYESGATITVDIHGRALAKGTQLVAWDAVPQGVAFQWDAEYAEELVTTDEGIFYGASDVAEAYWTNAKGDGDVDNPGNWACTNSSGQVVSKGLPISSSVIYLPHDIDFQVPAGKSISCAQISLVEGAQLTAGCDWRGLGEVKVVGTSLDLYGHSLTNAGIVTESEATLTITNTKAGDEDPPALLVYDIASGLTFENTQITLAGNLQLVKEGAGTFIAKKANQTYTGGTIVTAGVVKTGIQGTDYPFGPGSTTNPTPITIESGATFNLNGQTSHTVYRFILNGGTLTNTGADITTTGFGSLTLEADSTLAVPKTITGWSGHTIDLGGHTLTATIGDGKRLYLSGDHSDEPVIYKAGKIVVSTGGWLDFFRGKVNAKSVDFDINAALRVEVETDIHDYIARYNQNYNYGTAALNVYGTFKPMTAYWYGCTMQDGSTIDLSDRTGTWSVTSGFSGGSKTISFADGALVWVDLTGRTDLNEGNKIISWTTKPNAMFKVIPATTGVEVKDDGLYMAIKGGVPVVGPSGGSITIPMDWAEKYATGETPEQQYASLTADRTGKGNGVTLRDCYVLGLDPEVETSVPYMAPAQVSGEGKITLTVQGLDVKAESGALVKYQMMTKTTGDYGKSGDPVYVPTLETELPTSGVKYYKVDVIVTTPEAEKETKAPQVTINGKGYPSLAAAIGDAEAGDTLVVLGDLETGADINVAKDMTIDMNELTIAGMLNVKSGATLTVCGVGEFDGPITVEDGGKLDFKNGKHIS